VTLETFAIQLFKAIKKLLLILALSFYIQSKLLVFRKFVKMRYILSHYKKGTSITAGESCFRRRKRKENTWIEDKTFFNANKKQREMDQYDKITKTWTVTTCNLCRSDKHPISLLKKSRGKSTLYPKIQKRQKKITLGSLSRFYAKQ
jgi:hypothetical protein